MIGRSAASTATTGALASVPVAARALSEPKLVSHSVPVQRTTLTSRPEPPESLQATTARSWLSIARRGLLGSLPEIGGAYSSALASTYRTRTVAPSTKATTGRPALVSARLPQNDEGKLLVDQAAPVQVDTP